VKGSGLALLLTLAACWPAGAFAQTQPPAAPPAEQPAESLPEQVFIKPATIDNTLEVTGEAVAAREINTRMQVAVMVNEKGPFRFFVDSGADRSVIGLGLAARLGLPAGPTVLLHSTGSAREANTVLINTIRVGSSVIHDIAAPALPERFLGGDGMLGIDSLVDQRLTIDFDARTVVVQDTHQPERAVGSDEVMITARKRKGQLILTEANAGTRIAAVIDTGTEITVGNGALRAKLLRHRRTPVMTTTLISVTGDVVPADLLPIPEIRIGDLVLRNVLIAFTDVPPFKLFGLDREPAILLGTDILKSFRRVSLDFRRRKVRFTLRPESR
jgi:predicted aspartyl protease